LQNNTFLGDSLGLNLIVLDEVDSTNDYLKSQVSNFKPLPEWTAIMAKHQTRGRGQRDNVWHTPADQNITVSLLIYPKYLPPQQQFYLNIFVSLGIIDWLKSIHIEAQIKWPNDIMLANKKIAGILIENKVNSKGIVQSIIGIGINANQVDFPNELINKASSLFKETGIPIANLEESCHDVLLCIQKRIIAFKKLELSAENLLQEYNNLLFLRDISAPYSSNNIEFLAKIIRVESDGRLLLNEDGQEKAYYFKEVSFLLQ